MAELEKSGCDIEIIKKEAPQLASVLKEMKDGLDTVRSKVQSLTAKVKENRFPTADGISYLEAKHLLLLNYCQSLVYYLIRKAKGLSIEGHPVVKSLVEIRLFLEKIRPIDKKMQYQIQKLTRVTVVAEDKVGGNEKEEDAATKTEDDLKYRPNPDMLVSKSNPALEDGDGIYRPPRFAPTAMEGDKMSKLERNAQRKETMTLRHAKQSDYLSEMINDAEGRPEEVKEGVGIESREISRTKARFEKRAEREEVNFARAPLTKKEKKEIRQLRKPDNGLRGLADGFYDEIRGLPLDENDGEKMEGFQNSRGRERKFNKRKRKY